MTFSSEEKEKATQVSNTHIASIGTFHGIIGGVQADQVQVGDYASIHSRLKARGIPQEARNELKNMLDELKTAKGKKKKSLAKRGLEWVADHADTLGKLAGLLRGWFSTN